MPTPLRNIRVAEELWTVARAKAKANGTTLTAVIVAFLRRYVAR